jgi:hypothetical protein
MTILFIWGSAYNAFSLGSIRFAPQKRIWRGWAPLWCKFFVWMAINNSCWTANCLAKRGASLSASMPTLWLGGGKYIFNTSSSHVCWPGKFGNWFLKSWTCYVLLLNDPIFSSLVGDAAPSKEVYGVHTKAPIVWSF